MPLCLQQNRKHAGASQEPCSNQNLYCYYICSFVYTDVKNNFHVCKSSSAPLINAALWHYLGTYNLDFRCENNSTPGILIEEIQYLLTKSSNMLNKNTWGLKKCKANKKQQCKQASAIKKQLRLRSYFSNKLMFYHPKTRRFAAS